MDKQCEFEGKKVLIADDVSLNRYMAERIIIGNGGNTVSVKNGKAALDAFVSSAPGEYSMILMDVKMPIMDGLEATTLIRESDHQNAKDIPIIALTAEISNTDRQTCLDRGMNNYLAKPYSADQLISMIRMYL
ncbi:MAG TPA: response regulator [Bacillota bacterium]|nr:response regulator [Bacillota bacterium]